MAKNKHLIEQYKRLHQNIQQTTPAVYAAIALTLYREYGWDGDAIEQMFAASQVIWEECLNQDLPMLEYCEELTGIELKNR
jgi:hypothetical protein